MKKFLAMLVAAMMVLSLVAIPVFADGEVVFAVENAPATATPGNEITVNLTVNGTFEAHVLNMQFNYNADAFEYVSHTCGDVLNQIIDLGGIQLVDATTIPGLHAPRRHDAHRCFHSERHHLLRNAPR